MINQKLLIVDDEPRIRTSLKSLFEDKGFRVQTSSNGVEAIESFNKVPVKVILTDIRMPEMNGFDLIHKIKKKDPFVQSIFLTGYADMENIKTALKQNAFEFFQKPVHDTNILLNTVKKAESRYNRLKIKLRKKHKKEKALSVITKIMNSLDAIVYVSDMETYDLIFTNKKYNNEFGYKNDMDFTGEKCWKIIQKDPTGPCPFCTNSRILDDNALPMELYERDFYNKKTNKFYRIADKAIEWVDGRIVRLGTAYDITEKRKYEKRFKQYEKTNESLKNLWSLGTLAGGIAHKFNNSLSVISGHLDLIDVEFSEVARLKHHTRTMQTSTEKMAQLTASLLAYARGGKYRPEIFNLSKFIKEMLEHIEYKLPPAISLVTDFFEKDLHIKGDKAQIQMLVLAVLENAFEAMNQIGTIKIICEKEKIDQNEFKKLKTRFEKEYICLTIIDDGQGMDSETKERIFEPFFTTRFVGRGIGLSAAYGIVKNHNGFISVNSKFGKGSTIKIYFPIKMIHNVTSLKATPGSGGQSLTILLIEDENEVRKVIRIMLERMGHKVLEADTGQKAIHIAKLS